MDAPRVSIISLNYNGLADTRACLESLQACTYPNFEILLFDNGSADPQEIASLQALTDPRLRVFDNQTNLGFAEGNNVGIRLVLAEGQSEYIYFLNNDTTVDPDFLTAAVAAAAADDKIGIVASLSIQFGQRQKVENAGHDLLSCGDSVPRRRGARVAEQTQSVELLGACSAGALYKVATLKQCGGYDADFFLNFEDADLSLRCVVYGWRCVLAPQSRIYHKVNASIRKVKDEAYILRSQVNQLKAYWHNLPWGVVWLNLPWIILKELGILLGTGLTGRWKLTRLWWRIRRRFWQEWPTIRQVRRAHLAHQNVSTWYLWRHQKNFLGVYGRYFWEFVVRGKAIVKQADGDQ